MEPQIYEQIISKKDFSKLPSMDVGLAWRMFERRQVSDEEKVRLTRDLLRKVFSAFNSGKLLSLKDKDPKWILQKHISTRERLSYYDEIYSKLLSGFSDEKLTVFDLGAGVNGFSYNYLNNVWKKNNFYLECPPIHPQLAPRDAHRDLLFQKINEDFKGFREPTPDSRLRTAKSIFELLPTTKSLAHPKTRDFATRDLLSRKHRGVTVNYIAVEAVGQLVDLMNYYFCREGLNAKAIHEGLFNLDKIIKIVRQVKSKKIIFLFKTLDSLEMLERDYSKKLLLELTPLVNRVVVSFATRSLIARKKFNVKRSWIKNFINDNFNVLDEFEIGGELYVVFERR